MFLAIYVAKYFLIGTGGSSIYLDLLYSSLVVATLFFIANVVVSFLGASAEAGPKAFTLFTYSYIQKVTGKMAGYSTGYVAFHAGLLLMSICSACTTWYGLSGFLLNGSGGIIKTQVVPLLFATASAAITYSFWQRLFSISSNPNLSDRQRLSAVTLYPLGAAVFIFCISTLTSVLGMGGTIAVKQHYTYSISNYKQSLSTIMEYRKDEEAILPSLQQAAVGYTDEYEAEVAGGGKTGVVGEGSVANFLRETKDKFSRTHDFFDKFNKTVVETNRQLGETIGEVEKMLEDSDDVNEIERELQKALASIRVGLLELRNPNTLAVLESLISHMEYNKGKFSELSNKPGVAEAQKKALNAYGEMIEISIKELNGLLEPLRNRELPTIPDTKRINPLSAIFVYAKDIMPSWIFAISVDFWVVIWLILYWHIGSIAVMFNHKKQRVIQKTAEEAA